MLTLAANATAVTINFSDGIYSGVDEIYEENGFTFTAMTTSASGGPLNNHTDCGPAVGEAIFGITPFEVYCWHNGGGGTDVDRNVTIEGGAAGFDLVSLDIVDDIFGQNQVNPDPFTIDFISSAGD
jgi:hypothetical protein